MSVLVDTSVWSLALRRRNPPNDGAVRELQELIREGRVHLIGPIRQEVLSGIREAAQFQTLRDRLRSFPDLPLETVDHERAAEHFNLCRHKGVQGSNTDFLLCAVAERHNLAILTTDGDFESFSRHLPISLHRPRLTGLP
ncbi:MAG TPA: PIN domain-containing protein [Thermoanaerobaculia bacterium]|nr:PIN domain-containing protein [Thermoanaerobaculia bacterium]